MKPFSALGSIVFGIVALAHLLRAVLAWTIVIEDHVLAMWPSWAAFVVGGILCAGLWRESKST